MLPSTLDPQASQLAQKTLAEVARSGGNGVALTSAEVEQLEGRMLALPQVECSVVHHFGPGICIREVHMPAGTFAVGHAQRFEHWNSFIKGRVLMLNDDGTTRELVAPLMFVGKPGRKIGWVLEDVVWQNIFATDLRDADAVEAQFLDKTATWVQTMAEQQAIAHAERQADRDDYFAVLRESGFSHETAVAQSENTADQIDMPAGSYRVRVADSPIQGKGLFCTLPTDAGEVIAPARVRGQRTPAGRYTNHSINPNAAMFMRPNGDIDLVATRRIAGAAGGGPGEEITIDYRQALRLQGIRIKGDQA